MWLLDGLLTAFRSGLGRMTTSDTLDSPTWYVCTFDRPLIATLLRELLVDQPERLERMHLAFGADHLSQRYSKSAHVTSPRRLLRRLT